MNISAATIARIFTNRTIASPGVRHCTSRRQPALPVLQAEGTSVSQAPTITQASRRGGPRPRRRLAGALVGAITVFGASVGLAAPANAMTIVNGDMPTTYLGWNYLQWYDGLFYKAHAYSPPVGGQRIWCWDDGRGLVLLDSCWVEQFEWRMH